MAARTETQTDVLVVGAGVIGLACAWRLASAGLRVRVLETQRPGAGASGVAAGMLAPVGESTWGEERLLALALRSHALWPGFAAELQRACGRDVGYLPYGSLHVALDRDEADALRRRFELMRKHHLEAEWLRAGECRRLEPGLSPACVGGVSAPHEAAVDPRALVAALAEATTAAGAELRSHATVDEALIADGRLIGVRAGGERHLASETVLAAGSWSAAEWVPEAVRPPVRPIKGQILTLSGPPGEPVCERIVASERIYVVPRADGRLIVGATVEEVGFDRRVTAGGVLELLREAYRALPDVAELELTEAVAGLRPGSPDNLPLIGRSGLDGLVLATGHFRNGIQLAPVTAEAVAATIAGSAPPGEAAAADPRRFARATRRQGALA